MREALNVTDLNDVIEYLYLKRAKNLPAHALAEILDRLIWCLDDNGAELIEIQRKWLGSDDANKIEIALHMNEVCPYHSPEALSNQLEAIKQKFPFLADNCERFAELWKTQLRCNVC